MTFPISISKQSSGSRLLVLPRTDSRRAAVGNKTIRNIAGSHYTTTNRSQFIPPMSEEPDHAVRGGRGQGGDKRGNRSGGGRGAGRRAGAGAGGKGEMNREVAVSKALSKLLRHAAEDEGLALDNEGFARLDQVVSFSPSLPFNLWATTASTILSLVLLSLFLLFSESTNRIYHVDNYT